MSSIVGVIKAGWIVKSPPENRLYSALSRIYQAKWRRRWFVLLRQENVSVLPFELFYYEDDTCKKCKGKINLSDVHEIVVNFESEYDKTFALKTMHRQRHRTYYLTATDREDMMAWVRMLCDCCGLSADARQPATGANGSPAGTPATISARAATAPASLERSRAHSPPAPSLNHSLPVEGDENCANELRTSRPPPAAPRKTPNAPLDSPRLAAPAPAPSPARRLSDVRPDNDDSPYVNAAPAADPPPVPLKRHDTATAGTLRRPSITPAATPTPASAAAHARTDDEYVVLTDCRSGTDVSATPAAKPWPRRLDDPNDADYQPAPAPRPFGAPLGSHDFSDPDSDYLNVPAVSASFASPSDRPAVLPKSFNSLSRTRLLARSDADGLQNDAEFEDHSPASNYVRPPDVPVPAASAHALTPHRPNQPSVAEANKLQSSTRLNATPTRAVNDVHSASPKNNQRLFATPSKNAAVRSPLANTTGDESLDADSDFRFLRSHVPVSAAESHSGYLNVPSLPAKPRPQSPSVAVTNGVHTPLSSSGRPTVDLPKPAKSNSSSSDDDRFEVDNVDGDESTFRPSMSDRAVHSGSSIVFSRSNTAHAHQPVGPSNARGHALANDTEAHWRAQNSSASTAAQRVGTTRNPTQQNNVTNGGPPRREFGYAELDLPQASSDSPVHLTSRITYLDPKGIDFERTDALAKLSMERERQLERHITPVQLTASLNTSRNGQSSALTQSTTGTGSRKAK